jgi:hypothetical protein
MTVGGRWYLTLTTVPFSPPCWWDPAHDQLNLLMCRFYDSQQALASDPDYSPLLYSLLVGPCT